MRSSVAPKSYILTQASICSETYIALARKHEYCYILTQASICSETRLLGVEPEPRLSYILTQASICSETHRTRDGRTDPMCYILTQASICSETMLTVVLKPSGELLHLNSSQHLL